MNPIRILLIPHIKERICRNLTFMDVACLRNALGISSLKCTIGIKDRDEKIKFLKGVNDQTIRIYYNISAFGSIKAFREVIKHENVESAKTFLANGFDVNIVIQDRKGGYTPLILAARKNRLKILKFFLDFGANIKQLANYGGETALHWAIRAKNPEAVALLKSYGTKLESK